MKKRRIKSILWSCGLLLLVVFLACVNGHDAAADDLGDVSAGVDAERQHGDADAVVRRGENDVVNDHELHNHRRAADDRQIQLAEAVGQAEEKFPHAGTHIGAGFIPGGTNDGDNHADDDAENNGCKGDF